MSLLDQAKQAAPAANSAPQDGDGPDQEPDQSSDQGGPPATEEAISALQDKIKASVPPEQQSALGRIVLAGTKVLYSKDTSSMLTDELNSDESVDKKLAGGAAGLMSLLDRESNGKLPPELYIPAGALLLLDIAQFMVQGGDEVSMQDVRDGLDQMSALIQTHHGAPPDQVAQTVSGAAPAAQPAPEGTTQPPPQPQPEMPQ